MEYWLRSRQGFRDGTPSFDYVVAASSWTGACTKPTDVPLRAVLRCAQTVLNNNQNTTYSSGGDVLNYNPVINHIHVTEAEVRWVGQPPPDAHILHHRRTS